MSSLPRRARVLGGVAGPAAFIAAWSLLGRDGAGYSPVDDPISRLAAVDASSRWPMTAGFLAFGVGVALYSGELGRALPGGAGRAALTTAAATIGIAATPLESPLGGTAHAACAAVAYAALAATPLLGARSLAAQGSSAAAGASAAAGLAVAAALAASVVSPNATGLLQRLGLTIGDVWIMATASRMLRRGEADL